MKYPRGSSVVIAAVFVAGLLVGLGLNVRPSVAPTVTLDRAKQASPASIMLDPGDGRVVVYRDVALVANDTALTALTRTLAANKVSFVTKDYGPMGTLVEQIGVAKNGSANKYWQYWVNNISPEVGASSYTLQPGDVVEWKFLAYQTQ